MADAAKADKEAVLPTNYEVLQREITVLDVMTRNRDRRIWAVAAGSDVRDTRAVKVDDSDTPPFIDAQTNEPGKGPDGAHIFLDGDEAVTKIKLMAARKPGEPSGQPYCSAEAGGASTASASASVSARLGN